MTYRISEEAEKDLENNSIDIIRILHNHMDILNVLKAD